MAKHIYASKAIRLTPHACLDVHASAEAVVIGLVGDRSNIETHITTVKHVDALIRYLTEARAYLAAREG